MFSREMMSTALLRNLHFPNDSSSVRHRSELFTQVTIKLLKEKLHVITENK